MQHRIRHLILLVKNWSHAEKFNSGFSLGSGKCHSHEITLREIHVTLSWGYTGEDNDLMRLH